MKEFKPEGYFSLLTDKGMNIIARRPDGRKIKPFSGGCTADAFCSQAKPFLKQVIQVRSGDESGEPTVRQQKIYRTLWQEGHVRIENGHAENVFVMSSAWRDMP